MWRSRLVRGDREDFRIVCTRVGMISVSHAAAPFQLRLPLALASRSFLPTSEVSSHSLSYSLFRVGEGYTRSPEQRRAQETARSCYTDSFVKQMCCANEVCLPLAEAEVDGRQEASKRMFCYLILGSKEAIKRKYTAALSLCRLRTFYEASD